MIDTVKLRGLLEQATPEPIDYCDSSLDDPEGPPWDVHIPGRGSLGYFWREEDAALFVAARATLPALLDTLDAMQGAIERVRGVIDQGYPGTGGVDTCEHGKTGDDDCISCYDAALTAALEMPSDPTIRHRGRG